MSRQIFGLDISPLAADAIGRKVVEEAPPDGAVGLIVTPNVQHVALLRESRPFREAYARAALIVCDGFPVHYYAKLRGAPSPERVTGCDIADEIMDRRVFPERHRFFFVVDTEETALALGRWAEERGLRDRIATAVPPFGFDRDETQCRVLAAAIRDHGTTILFMGLGAPKSEIFVDAHRDLMPPCWALCVGQAVKMAIGLVPRPPAFLKHLNLEWIWRMALEPRRMIARYGYSIRGFIAAVKEDLRSPQ